jgi:hypothetical protein
VPWLFFIDEIFLQDAGSCFEPDGANKAAYPVIFKKDLVAGKPSG